MSSATDLWGLFVREGAEQAQRLHQAPLATSQAGDFESLATGANAIAMPALMLGCGAIAHLALDCERALLDLAEGRVAPEELATALQQAAAELVRAFESLGAHDEGDCDIHEAALAHASHRIARRLAGEEPLPTTRRSIPCAAPVEAAAPEVRLPASPPTGVDPPPTPPPAPPPAPSAPPPPPPPPQAQAQVSENAGALPGKGKPESSGMPLWDLFVKDGSEQASQLEQAARAGLADIDPEALAVDVSALATQALLMGCEAIGRLALECERALVGLAQRRTDAPRIQRPLHEAAAALGAAFEALAEAGESSADSAADTQLEAARHRLTNELSQRSIAPAPAPDKKQPATPAASPSDEPETPAPPRSDAPSVPQPAPVQPVVEAPVSTGPASPEDDDTWHWEPTTDDELVQLFFVEADERFANLDDRLLQLEQHPDDGELVGNIFRDLHTIKGNAGLVGLAPVKNLAHAAEDLLSMVRDGERRADRGVVDMLIDAVEGLRALIRSAIERSPLDRRAERQLTKRLRDPAPQPAEAGVAVAEPTPAPADEVPAPREIAEEPRPAPPATFKAPGAAARGTGHQMLRIDFAKLDRLMNLVGELVVDKANLNASLQRLTTITSLVESGRKQAAAASRGADTPAARAQLQALVEKLGLLERTIEDTEQEFDRASHQLDNVAGDLRDQVMQLRMVPIGSVFRRFGVKVRELSIKHDKNVHLELVGERTELDKMLIDQLGAPLLHLVTNAVYHGIETPAVRAAAGKDSQALLRLCAYQQGNQIVIELHDDGAGIDPDAIRSIARERNIRTAEELAAMDDRETLLLIVDPRFSKVTQVDEDAGRGVGMTVVWKTIVTTLKGSIEIDSKVGVGTTFTLKLPLTLAIIQVLLLRVGSETVAMPLDIVNRTLACSGEDFHVVCDREVLTVSERQIPLVRLADALGSPGERRRSDNHHVILVDLWGQTYGLVCDRLIGKQEVVIKSLGDLLEEVPCVAGATLLRDRCVIIIDVPAIIDRASRVDLGPPPSAARSQPSDSSPPRPRRILVVDDSSMVRQSITRILEDEGYAVASANDGVEALELTRNEAFDLISTDATMPNMDGFELTRALRTEGSHRDTPIVMVTNRDETADRVRGFDAGVDAYVTKPFEREELLRIIASQLRRILPSEIMESP